MKKLGLFLLCITLSFPAFAHTLEQKWQKIYDGFFYNVGSYSLMFCIKSDYLMSGMKNPIQDKDIENKACLDLVEKFYPVASSDIKKVTEVEVDHAIMYADEQSTGKPIKYPALKKGEKDKILENAKEVQQILAGYTAEQNQNLIDFYELTLRTSAGPVPGGSSPGQSEFFKQVRTKLKLKALPLSTCTKFHSKDLCNDLL